MQDETPEALEEKAALAARNEATQNWLRDNLPEWMFQDTFLLQTWQWLGLLVLIFFGIILDKVVVLILRGTLRKFVNKFHVEVEANVLKTGTRPFGLLAMAVFWYVLLPLLMLPDQVEWPLRFAAKIIAVGAAVWGAYRLVDVLTAFLLERAKKTASKFDDLLIPLIRTTLKAFIAVFGVVFIASNIPDLNIGSMLAGLGLGGLAFALAAKDAVSNIFGSLTVILDRPFQVGDWVIIDNVEGTVEEVGIRSTRLRTFYNSVITVPNAIMITAKVDNMGQRQYRRWKAMVGVTYDTSPRSWRLSARASGKWFAPIPTPGRIISTSTSMASAPPPSTSWSTCSSRFRTGRQNSGSVTA